MGAIRKQYWTTRKELETIPDADQVERGIWKSYPPCKSGFCRLGRPLFMKVVQLNGKLPWQCFRSNTGSWIAVCDLLKVTIEAETWTLLMEGIGESINTIFKDLFESDQLNRFLREHRWKPVGALPSSPGNICFDIPFLPRIIDPAKNYHGVLSRQIKSALFTDGWRKFKFAPSSRRRFSKRIKKG